MGTARIDTCAFKLSYSTGFDIVEIKSKLGGGIDMVLASS